MSSPEPKPPAASAPWARRGCVPYLLVAGAILGVLSLFVLPCLVVMPVMLALEIGFGWMVHLANGGLEQIRFDHIAWGALLLLLTGLVGASLAVLRWRWGGERQLGVMGTTVWTSRILLSGGALSVVGFAMAAFATEFGKLYGSRTGVWRDTTYEAAHRMGTMNNLRHLSLATLNYAVTHNTLPAGGTFDEIGRPMHSWITQVLPLIGREQIHDRIRFELPWNAPENFAVFEIPMRDFVRSGHWDQLRTPEGYAVTDFATNGYVIGGGRPLALSAVTDGQSATLLMGEVLDRPHAWGDPHNWRDPGLGINTSPEGFGSPWSSDGCTFAFVDGSARFLSAKIDPSILKKLATPAGGEPIGDGEF